ncbi:MAG: ABC transporter ATP-binding protein, partial [bacterium]
ILIARLMLESADILILDEPTNDLDIPSLEVLESALSDFTGTMILVTHDRYMLDRLCSELLYLDGNGAVTPYADYPQWEDAQRAGKATQKAAVAKEGSAKSNTTTKKLNWKEARELEGIEATILTAEGEVTRLECELASPELFTEYDRLTKLSTELQDAQEHVKKLYLRWEALEVKRDG